MDYNLREISNAVMINSLDNIIQQESWKLEMDKNTGLLAKKSKVVKVQRPLKENEKVAIQNVPIFKDLKSYYLPKLSHSCDHVSEIERSKNVFVKSPGYVTTNSNNNCIDAKHNQLLLKEKMGRQTHNRAHNEFDKCSILLNNENNTNLISPDIKVRRNVRFGEYSPLNPANQVNSQPFLGIGEYDDKRKKQIELQRKEYIEYLSKTKQDKNISDLPKLADYSCEEAFKTAMEDNNSEQIKLGVKAMHNKEDSIQLGSFIDGESCASDESLKKETNRLKQELYRYELSKQIEEKKRLELKRKQKEQMEDEAIERAAREQQEKIKKELEKEAEKRTLAQLQLQQEKLRNEIMQKQKDFETKTWNVAAETISRQVSKHTPSRHESFVDDVEFHCPPESTFDNVPLPTTRVRVPRKIIYDDETESKRMRDVSCNTNSYKNSCMNQTISPPVMRKNVERAHVTFAREPPLNNNEYNPAALLPVTKSVIIDSPHTLALAGIDDNEEGDKTYEAVEPTKAYRNQISSKDVLIGHNQELLTDKHLLSNLGNIRKQLDIEHQRLKQQVRRSQ